MPHLQYKEPHLQYKDDIDSIKWIFEEGIFKSLIELTSLYYTNNITFKQAQDNVLSKILPDIHHLSINYTKGINVQKVTLIIKNIFKLLWCIISNPKKAWQLWKTFKNTDQKFVKAIINDDEFWQQLGKHNKEISGIIFLLKDKLNGAIGIDVIDEKLVNVIDDLLAKNYRELQDIANLALEEKYLNCVSYFFSLHNTNFLLNKFFKDQKVHIRTILQQYIEHDESLKNKLKELGISADLLEVVDILLAHPKELSDLLNILNADELNKTEQIISIYETLGKDITTFITKHEKAITTVLTAQKNKLNKAIGVDAVDKHTIKIIVNALQFDPSVLKNIAELALKKDYLGCITCLTALCVNNDKIVQTFKDQKVHIREILQQYIKHDKSLQDKLQELGISADLLEVVDILLAHPKELSDLLNILNADELNKTEQIISIYETLGKDITTFITKHEKAITTVLTAQKNKLNKAIGVDAVDKHTIKIIVNALQFDPSVLKNIAELALKKDYLGCITCLTALCVNNDKIVQTFKDQKVHIREILQQYIKHDKSLQDKLQELGISADLLEVVDILLAHPKELSDLLNILNADELNKTEQIISIYETLGKDITTFITKHEKAITTVLTAQKNKLNKAIGVDAVDKHTIKIIVNALQFDPSVLKNIAELALKKDYLGCITCLTALCVNNDKIVQTFKDQKVHIREILQQYIKHDKSLQDKLQELGISADLLEVVDILLAHPKELFNFLKACNSTERNTSSILIAYKDLAPDIRAFVNDHKDQVVTCLSKHYPSIGKAALSVINSLLPVYATAVSAVTIGLQEISKACRWLCSAVIPNLKKHTAPMIEYHEQPYSAPINNTTEPMRNDLG